jgi:hypothetical protein
MSCGEASPMCHQIRALGLGHPHRRAILKQEPRPLAASGSRETPRPLRRGDRSIQPL